MNGGIVTYVDEGGIDIVRAFLLTKPQSHTPQFICDGHTGGKHVSGDAIECFHVLCEEMLQKTKEDVQFFFCQKRLKEIF